MIVVVLSMLAMQLFSVWLLDQQNRKLTLRNEELTDQLLRFQGKQPIFQPEVQTLRKGAGRYDGIMAPSQKENQAP